MLAKELEFLGWRILNTISQGAASPSVRESLKELADGHERRQRFFSGLLASPNRQPPTELSGEYAGRYYPSSYRNDGLLDVLLDIDGDLPEDVVLQKLIEFTRGIIEFFQRLGTSVSKAADQAVLEAVIQAECRGLHALQARLDACGGSSVDTSNYARRSWE